MRDSQACPRRESIGGALLISSSGPVWAALREHLVELRRVHEHSPFANSATGLLDC